MTIIRVPCHSLMNSGYRIIKITNRRALMKNPLDSLWGTVISGFVLTLVLLVIVTKFIGV